MSLSRHRPLAAALALAVALGVVAAAAPSSAPAARAAIDCELTQPYSRFDGTSMELVYAAETGTGGTAEIYVPQLCAGGSVTATELSNDEGVTVAITPDGTLGAMISLSAPTGDFAGLARVDLQFSQGATTIVLELYGLFGVEGTRYPFDRPDPISTPVSTPALFPISGIVLRDGATITAEIARSTQPVVVEWVESPQPGFRVTPPVGYTGPVGVEVVLTDGVSAELYSVVQWAGVPIPTTAIWAPNPPPAATEPDGIGYFDIGGSFVPPGSECEIRVTTVPDVTIAVDPPDLSGISYGPIAVDVREPDFVGLLTTTYALTCELPDQTTSRVAYQFLLYVGIPIPQPELAATGVTSDVVPAGLGALALLLAGAVLLRRRAVHGR
jgi:LPXTG-motif cell wall-anchored protein